MKALLLSLAFVAILGSLGTALFFMMRSGTPGDGDGDGEDEDARKSGRMARALAFRVGFSILLFVCILVAWKLGYLRPTGIPLTN